MHKGGLTYIYFIMFILIIILSFAFETQEETLLRRWLN